MATEGLIFGRFINFIAVLSRNISDAPKSLRFWRVCLYLAIGENFSTIVLIRDNDNIDQSY